jgi:hypothetical protein
MHPPATAYESCFVAELDGKTALITGGGGLATERTPLI